MENMHDYNDDVRMSLNPSHLQSVLVFEAVGDQLSLPTQHKHKFVNIKKPLSLPSAYTIPLRGNTTRRVSGHCVERCRR